MLSSLSVSVEPVSPLGAIGLYSSRHSRTADKTSSRISWASLIGGRWAGGNLWVEPTTDRVNDGVATVIIGSNDYAGAWAVDPQGRSAYAVVPGGEPQREQAFRFGVNLVMYALTGNYKTDQVHVPAILERLGQ